MIYVMPTAMDPTAVERIQQERECADLGAA